MIVRNIAIAALLAIGTSTTALAATDTQALREDIGFALTDKGYLDVVVNNGVAHIFGYANAIDIAKAKRLALRSEGIKRVVVSATTIN